MAQGHTPDVLEDALSELEDARKLIENNPFSTIIENRVLHKIKTAISCIKAKRKYSGSYEG